MANSINNYTYPLLRDRIAQTPAVPRESAKLMHLSRKSRSITHRTVGDLSDIIQKGDVLVINNTKVFHARLRSGNKELFLIRPIKDNMWQAIGKKISSGMQITFSDDFIATIHEKYPDGTYHVSFNQKNVFDFANKYGEVPVPPYIKTIPKNSNYQTIYAKYEGSVAAPTAGFHLTKNILKRLKEKGVEILEITLHVGLGTFLPVKTTTIEEYIMHSEWVEILPEVAGIIATAKKEHRRIVAVGTTSTRALEGTKAQAFQGDVNLFIQPGFKFTVVDAMLTNFHLPKSTLLILVSTFAGREFILQAYNEAVKHKYRFYSFGDAMFIS